VSTRTLATNGEQVPGNPRLGDSLSVPDRADASNGEQVPGYVRLGDSLSAPTRTLATNTSTAFAVGGIAIGVLYQLLTLCRPGAHNGQTVGDQLLGITVARDDGQPFGLTTFVVCQALFQLLPSYAIRAIPQFGGLLILWAAVDDFWPLWDRESRALHDFAAKTHVERARTAR
jgi:uncharacterized RDD family membrane protein YckC